MFSALRILPDAAMLKRNGKPIRRGYADDQLSLFDFAGNNERTTITLPDSVRPNGREALAGVLPKMVAQLEAEGRLMEALWEAQETTLDEMETLTRQLEREQRMTPEQAQATGVGVDPGEVYSPAAREPERLNQRNYRITPADQLGAGGLKQKARDNFAAIELAQRLDAEGRLATDEERRVLVRYVGWGGIPQVFAYYGAPEWQAERDRLKALLPSEQFEAARASTLNAHYTSTTVISGIYEAVERLGFRGGRVLEPALGIGHFFGLMPPEIAARSRLTGIELDPLTASIARHLYPDADIRAQGFEAARLVEASFDLAISNVPFGDYKLHDPQFNDRNFLVHDYFFAKGLQQVRPGGLLVFITSKGTLDKLNSGLRDYLYDKADLLGAIRLPNTAFQQNANTEVTTDIIFLRRLAEGEKPTGPAWQKLAEHTDGRRHGLPINEYFAANPHMMLGRMAMESTMYRAGEPALVPDGRDLAAALREAVAALPADIYREREQTNQRQTAPEAILAPDFVKENAFTLHEGMLAVRIGGTLTTLEKLPEETGRRIRGLIKVRDAVREVLRTQLEDAGEDEILEARRRLNCNTMRSSPASARSMTTRTVAPSAPIQTTRCSARWRTTTRRRSARRRRPSSASAPSSRRKRRGWPRRRRTRS
jgi:hypothetical protein